MPQPQRIISPPRPWLRCGAENVHAFDQSAPHSAATEAGHEGQLDGPHRLTLALDDR
jgi:hypothetical protein